ncbi:MAG TPA: hypothetical protein VMV18_11615 [bacterium]|nr:hypothetical protein [bacterium]
MKLSERARGLLRETAIPELRGPFLPHERLAQARDLLAAAGVPETDAVMEYARELYKMHYDVRGDGAPRDFRLGAKAWRAAAEGVAEGWVIPALFSRGDDAPPILALHQHGALLAAEGTFSGTRPLVPLAASFASWLEFEAALDALADERRSFWRVTARAPIGAARRLAARFSLAPVDAASDGLLEAWRGSGILVRARRDAYPEPRLWIDACVPAEGHDVDALAGALEEMTGHPPARQSWTPG